MKSNKFSGPLAVLNGFSKTTDISGLAHEETESKNPDHTDHSDAPSPIPQKLTNTFSVSGKTIRLSKAATTGRISVPQPDFQIPSKKFERPKMHPEDHSPSNSPDSKKPIEQANQFTVLAEIPSPRHSLNLSKESNNLNNNSLMNPYHAICEEDEHHSDLDNIEDISNSQELFSPTRGRSKSDDGQSRKNSAVIQTSRNTLIGENSLGLDRLSNQQQQQHENHRQQDSVSGFDENSNDNSNEQSSTPTQNSNIVHLPPIILPPPKNWNVADIEEESCP